MSASKEIDAKIASLGDWRGAALAKVRRLIREAVALNLAHQSSKPGRGRG